MALQDSIQLVKEKKKFVGVFYVSGENCITWPVIQLRRSPFSTQVVMNVCKASPLCSIILRAQVTQQQDRSTAVPEKTARHVLSPKKRG